MLDTNLIIGKKNTGKTRYILFNEVKKAINNGENLCVFNTRDEYFKTFSKKLKDNNYNLITLNLNDTTKSNGYNPLLLPYELYKNNKVDEAATLINNLALELFKEDNPNVDPFWENMAANYFTGLVLILFKEDSIDKINLGSIQVMMSQCEEEIEDTTYLKKYLSNIDVTDTIYNILSPIEFAPTETRGSILSVAKQKLNLYLLREQLLNLLNTNEININKITNKTAIIIIADKTRDIANIFIDQLIEISKLPFTYILDNFDALKVILSFNKLIDNASYNGNKVYVSVHNEEMLKDKYGKYILDKFDNIIDLNKNLEIINEYEEIKIGDNKDYPILEMKKHEYLNFIKLMENKL